MGEDRTHAAVSDSRARQLAGLRPFVKGYDPRRNVGSGPGRAFTEHMRDLSRVNEEGEAVYSTEQLKALVENGKTPHPKAAAARQLLATRELGWSNSGTPFALADVKEMLDRELGMSIKRVEMSVETVTKPADLASDAIALIRQDPRLIRPLWPRLLAMTRYAPTIREQLRPILQQHAPDLAAALDTVDTTARALPAPDAT